MIIKKQAEEHVHQFTGNWCPCGAVSCTYAEFGKWKKEWDEYYKRVEGTESYALYNTMLLAMKENKIDEIVSLRDRAREIRLEQVWLPKPEGEDPVILKSKKKLVIID